MCFLYISIQIDATRKTAATNLVLKRRQKNATQAPAVIDLTTKSDKKTSARTKKIKEWVNVEDISITEEDRDILLHPTAWMTDNILTVDQWLLQKQMGTRGLQCLAWADISISHSKERLYSLSVDKSILESHG